MGKTRFHYFDKDEPAQIPEIPKSIAVCPICKQHLIIEDIDEWEVGTGRVTESGLHITCVTQPDWEDDDWEDWVRGHFSMPYVDWLPVQAVVYRWFDGRYRLKGELITSRICRGDKDGV